MQLHSNSYLSVTPSVCLSVGPSTPKPLRRYILTAAAELEPLSNRLTPIAIY